MRKDHIKTGCTYESKNGMARRCVVAIGDEYRPGTALTTGVLYSESRWRMTKDGATETITRDNRGYLDSFAAWAKKKV